MEEEFDIKEENEWTKITKERLKEVIIPPNWKYELTKYNFKLLFSLADVLYLVREVKQTNVILKSKSASYKKAQFIIKSFLRKLFPQEGNNIYIIYFS